MRMRSRVDRSGRRRPQLAARLLSAVATAVVVLVAGAGPAGAHAGLVSASPGAGTGLPAAPGAVVLRFSEPLNRQLSAISVLDPSGRDVGAGSTEAVQGDPRAMQRKLGLLRPGSYLVRWTSVSTLDGHALSGTYHWAVGTEAAPGEQVASGPVDSEGVVGLGGRWAGLVGLTLWVGLALLAPVAARAEVDAARLRRLGWGAPALALAGGALAVVGSSLSATGSAFHVASVLTGGRSGVWRSVLLGATACGAGLGLRGRGARWATPLAGVALVAEAASGHAAANGHPVLAAASIAVHLAAVGVWVFAIASCLLSTRLVAALAAFSPYAVGAAVVVAGTGALNAAFELARPADLVHTGYGVAVLAKIVVLGVMASLGLTHWLVRRRTPAAAARASVPLRLEGIAALVALAVATVLVGFPNPPQEAAAAERQEGADPALLHLAGREALSIGEASGPFVVGLTVLPPRPGPVEYRVQVLGVDPGDGLRDAVVLAEPARGGTGDEARLAPCGFGCFAGHGRIPTSGTWRLSVNITSNRELLRVVSTVPLPTPDGDAAVSRALAAMGRLRSARLDEHLSGSVGSLGVTATYVFRAPDAFAFQVNGADRIEIGTRIWQRDTTAQPWSQESDPVGFSWPAGYFRSFWGPGVGARVLGVETVDGVPSEVVAFVRPELPAWIRIWVGVGDGLVRREQMRAEGHIMEHTWGGFDAPMVISPPR